MAEKAKEFWREHVGDKISRLKTAFKTRGIRGLTYSIAADLLAWKNTEIKIALTGKTGAGKSTFINALRGLNSDSEGGAATEKRFSEEDIWLAKEIEARGRPFYFIRTKFDSELKNEKRRRKLIKPLNPSEEDELKTKLLDELKRYLKDLKCKDNIFIIDSFERNKFDFPELEKRLKNDSIKKEAIILTLEAVTVEAINEKKTILEDRIWRAALRAAFAPRVTDADVAILLKEKEFYLEQFNLDVDSLRHDASLAHITDDELSELLENPNFEEDTTQELTYIDEIATFLPFLPIANHIRTYRTGKKFLTSALDSVVKRAIEVNKKMASEIAGQC